MALIVTNALRARATRERVKAQVSLVLSSVPRKERRKVQEKTSLTAKSARKSCTFLRDLVTTWRVVWHDSAGSDLGSLRKYKNILCFVEKPGAATRVSF